KKAIQEAAQARKDKLQPPTERASKERAQNSKPLSRPASDLPAHVQRGIDDGLETMTDAKKRLKPELPKETMKRLEEKLVARRRKTPGSAREEEAATESMRRSGRANEREVRKALDTGRKTRKRVTFGDDEPEYMREPRPT